MSKVVILRDALIQSTISRLEYYFGHNSACKTCLPVIGYPPRNVQSHFDHCVHTLTNMLGSILGSPNDFA